MYRSLARGGVMSMIVACGSKPTQQPPTSAQAANGVESSTDLSPSSDETGRDGAVAVGPARPCPTTNTDSRTRDTWLRDCNAPHGREYYRVYISGETAYMVPRPDGTPAIDALCSADDVRPILDRYGWCDEAADPDRVNHMRPDDALAIAHALHAG
jgi:hypothetical protein